jgi:hypothetical protein
MQGVNKKLNNSLTGFNYVQRIAPINDDYLFWFADAFWKVYDTLNNFRIFINSVQSKLLSSAPKVWSKLISQKPSNLRILEAAIIGKELREIQHKTL